MWSTHLVQYSVFSRNGNQTRIINDVEAICKSAESWGEQNSHFLLGYCWDISTAPFSVEFWVHVFILSLQNENDF